MFETVALNGCAAFRANDSWRNRARFVCVAENAYEGRASKAGLK